MPRFMRRRNRFFYRETRDLLGRMRISSWVSALLFGVFVAAPTAFCEPKATDLPIVNFAKVNDTLYRGGRPTEEGLQYLVAQGVVTDIDLQGGDYVDPKLNDYFEQGEAPQAIADEKATAEKLGLVFYNFPLNSVDDVTSQEDAMIDQALEIMNDQKQQPVFVHCQHGKDRSGLLVALYRIKYMGWSIGAAHKEWEAYGHTDLDQVVLHGLDAYFYKKGTQLLVQRLLSATN